MCSFDPVVQRGIELGQINVAMAVGQLEKKAISIRRISSWFLIPVWLMVFIGYIILMLLIDFQSQSQNLQNRFPVGALLAIIFVTFGLVFILVWRRWILTKGPKLTRNRLEKSDLAVRIASGTIEPERMFEFVPRLLRFGIHNTKSTEFKEVIEHIGANLNWYLNPPRTHYPGLEFLVYPAFFLFMFLVPDLWMVIQSLMVVCFFPTIINSSWQSVNNAELAGYLKKRLET